MNDVFGCTRTVVKSRYALITPDGAVASLVPGWTNARVVVCLSPALGGPRFTQMHITLAVDGIGAGNTGRNQYFFYVIEGSASITMAERLHRLEVGGYAYLPPNTDLQVKSRAAGTKLLVFQKPFVPSAGEARPASLVAHERDVPGQLVPGTVEARRQPLLPDSPAFDMAADLLTFPPGDAPAFVETHVMEHGLLMLRGQGLWRFDQDYHPVKAGDVIWVGAYCPHWFVATGSTPANFISYRDVNRDPM